MGCMQKPGEEVDCEKGKVPLFVHKYNVKGRVCYLGPCLGCGFALITGVRLGEVKVAYPISEQELCLSDTEVGTAAEVTALLPLPSAIRSSKTGRLA